MNPDIEHAAILPAMSRRFRGKPPVFEDAGAFAGEHSGKTSQHNPPDRGQQCKSERGAK